jgi:hypothetical protein
MEPTVATNNINHIASSSKFILIDPKTAAAPDFTFSVANLHVNHWRTRTVETQEVRAVSGGDRAEPW